MQQVETLEDHADTLALLAQLLVTEQRQVLAVHEDAPGSRALQQVQAAQQSTLARPAPPHDPEDRTVGNLQ
eukprot:gene16800-biopygen8722